MSAVSLVTGLVWVPAIGSGLLAGVFFAFSSFVMPALSRVDVPAGIAVMREINVAVYRSAFMPVFGAVSVTALLLAGLSVWRWGEHGSALILAGALIHLFGGFTATAAFNVPLNGALAALDPAGPQITQFWPRYVTSGRCGTICAPQPVPPPWPASSSRSRGAESDRAGEIRAARPE